MRPSVDFHRIAAVELQPVSHFPANDEHEEFWTREMDMIDRHGDAYTVRLYSNVGPEALEFHDKTPRKETG